MMTGLGGYKTISNKPLLLIISFVIIFTFIGRVHIAAQSEQQVDPFYLKLVKNGIYFYDEGNYAEAIENFEIAFFGFTDHPPILLECYIYLTVCHREINNEEKTEYYYSEIKSQNIQEYMDEIKLPKALMDKYHEITAYFSRLTQKTKSSSISSKSKPPAVPSLPADNTLESEADQLKKLIKSNRKNSESYFKLSTIYLEQNKIKEAKSILADLLKIDKKNGNAYFEMGKIFLIDNKKDKALEQFLKANLFLQNNIELHYQTAKLYYETENYQKAEQEFQKVQEINKTYKDTEKYLSSIAEKTIAKKAHSQNFLNLARQTNDLNKKIMYYRQALRTDPSNIDIHFEMSSVYVDENKYKEAVSILESLLDEQPENMKIFEKLGNIYFDDKNYKNAIRIFKQAKTKEEDNIEWSYLLGKTYIEDKKYQEALDELKKVIEKDPAYKNAPDLIKICLEKIKE